MNHLLHFLIYQFLIYVHQILKKLNRYFRKSDVPTLVSFFKSAFVVQLDKSNSTFTFAPEDFGFRKYSFCYKYSSISFLSIQLLNELLYPFYLTYNLLPFLLFTFSILDSFWFFFFAILFRRMFEKFLLH